MSFNLKDIQNEIIGNQSFVDTPYGKRVLTYADYTASGRGIAFIERYMLNLEKHYANSHTQDSFTGKRMTQLVHDALKNIKKLLNANENYVIPTGTGSTGAIKRLAEIMGIYCPPALKNTLNKDLKSIPVVFVGPYEHHSNELIWREGIAEVVVIGMTKDGDIDLNELTSKLKDKAYKNRLKIGSFSAGSNVTGIKSNIYNLARLLHAHGAYACFDFAASGPYVEIDVNKDKESYFDAIYLSPHKFLGGPATCGLLVINKRLYNNTQAPTTSGGGTVDYVSAFAHDYTADVEMREMAGTPGILQIIKANLALELKAEIGIDTIESIENNYTKYAFECLSKIPNVEILGNQTPEKRISIFSFNIKSGKKYLHHAFVTTLLNDLFGIQSRAGCACAGPYGHKLLNIGKEKSNTYRKIIADHINALKPGWVRVNFHYVFTLEQVDFICKAIAFIAEKGHLFLQKYTLDMASGTWQHLNSNSKKILNFNIKMAYQLKHLPILSETALPPANLYANYLEDAFEIANTLEKSFNADYARFADDINENNKWYLVKHFNAIKF